MDPLRLRSPIFDHGVLGIPIRKLQRRGAGTSSPSPKDEQELAELKEMGRCLADAKDPFNKNVWRALAKQVSLPASPLLFYLQKSREKSSRTALG